MGPLNNFDSTRGTYINMFLPINLLCIEYCSGNRMLDQRIGVYHILLMRHEYVKDNTFSKICFFFFFIVIEIYYFFEKSNIRDQNFTKYNKCILSALFFNYAIYRKIFKISYSYFVKGRNLLYF